MPYVKSRALVEFGRGITMVSDLLALESTYPDPPPPIVAGVVEGLRGGAAVLMVAVFEGFLRDVLPERVDAVRQRQVSFAALPESMRVQAVFGLLEREVKAPKYQNSPQTRAQRVPGIVTASALLGAGSFRADVFGDTQSNPGAETLKALCSNVGIRDPFKVLAGAYDARVGSPSAMKFVEQKLDEIVQRRHAVAHTGSVANVSRAQLAEARDFLNVLGEVLDESLFSHCEQIV